MGWGALVVSAAWRQFQDEIARWDVAGRTVDFWWRDDDACRPDPALARLIALADGAQVPLALAVIPADAVPAAFESLAPVVTLLQHGVDHRNRALANEKKTEFSAREPLPAALARLAQGRAQLESVAPGRSLAVLVPPWNRISMPQLIAELAGAGYRGLSTFGPRVAAQSTVSLVLANTHVDVIDWRGTRGFVGEDAALEQATRHLVARRTGLADPTEATGWLTHHATHDEPAWTFLARLLERTRDQPAVRWRSAADLFCDHRSK